MLKRLQLLRRSVSLPAPEQPGSLALRHVDCGSCNGCEHELSNVSGPHYDFARHGLSVVASPRHADALLITGTVTTRMAGPLRATYQAMPEPRLVAALGNCALGSGVIGNQSELAGPVEELLPVDIRIPGCPPSPGEIAEALLAAIDLVRRPEAGDES